MLPPLALTRMSHGRPHEEGIEGEDAAAAGFDEDVRDVVDDADGVQPAYDEEDAREQKQGLEIYLFERKSKVLKSISLSVFLTPEKSLRRMTV